MKKNEARPRLIGGISRSNTGGPRSPFRYNLAIDRNLCGGKLDVVELSEQQILRLVSDGAKALNHMRRMREKEEERKANEATPTP